MTSTPTRNQGIPISVRIVDKDFSCYHALVEHGRTVMA